MRYFLSFYLLLFSSIGLAGTEEAIILDMKLSIDGNLVSQPKIISISGETASIKSVSKDGTGISIAVTPTLQKKNQVLMKFVLTKLENDKETILSQPQIITLLGQSAEISEKSKGRPNKKMSLTVTPTLKD